MLTSDDEATRASSISDVELGSKAMEVGEERLDGKANVCVILVISDDNTNKLVAVEAMIA
jgi:hypothetical protein